MEKTEILEKLKAAFVRNLSYEETARNLMVGIAELGGQDAVPFLKEQLLPIRLKHGNMLTYKCLAVISKLAPETLMQLLKDKAYEDIHDHIIRQLSIDGRQEVAPCALKRLKAIQKKEKPVSKDFYLMDSCISALGRLRYQEALPTLLGMLETAGTVQSRLIAEAIVNITKPVPFVCDPHHASYVPPQPIKWNADEEVKDMFDKDGGKDGDGTMKIESVDTTWGRME